MPADGEFDCRYTLIFPKAEAFAVDDVLNFISEVKNPCNHHPESKRVPFFSSKWPEVTGDNTSNEQTDSHSSNGVCNRCAYDRNSFKKYLTGRLQKAVVEGRIELWNTFAEKVKEPPANNDAFLWAVTASIYRSDLIKFCRSEKIRVIFEDEQATSQTICTTKENIANPNEDIALPVRIQSGLEPAINSQDALSTPVKQAVLISSVNTNRKANDMPPGKMPRTAIGKLAIEAAWEIERTAGRKASASEVIKRLQEWVTSKRSEDLIEIISHGVKWMTNKLKIKPYDIEACQKTLITWHKSRA